MLETCSLLLCIAVGFIIALIAAPFVGQDWPNPEMISRTTNGALIVGVLIACPSGVGVAISMLMKNASSLVGVAISASLLPPAVNCGIMWGYCAVGNFEEHELSAYDFFVYGGYSLSLALLNIVCIVGFAYMTFKFKLLVNYPGRPELWKLMNHRVELSNVTVKGSEALNLARRIRTARGLSDIPENPGSESEVPAPPAKNLMNAFEAPTPREEAELEMESLNNLNNNK